MQDIGITDPPIATIRKPEVCPHCSGLAVQEQNHVICPTCKVAATKQSPPWTNSPNELWIWNYPSVSENPKKSAQVSRI